MTAVLAALLPLAHAGQALAATNTKFAFTADAFGTSASTSLGIGSGRSAYVILSCTVRPQSHSNSVANVSIPGVLATGAVDTSVSSAIDTTTGTYSDQANSTTASVVALGGLIQATTISANAAAAENSGGGTASGSVNLVGLTIGGHTISAHPAPNTQVTIAGVATVTLNAQKKITTAARALMNIDAIVIKLLPGNNFGAAGATITVSHALATVSGPVSGLLSGRAFGSSLAGGPVSSGPSFPVYLPCTGTGGATVKNQGAGVSAGALTVGAITDTANGTDNATQLSGRTTSTVATASVSRVLSATAISVDAHAAVVSGNLQVSGGLTLTSLSVLGVAIVLPDPVPANFSIPLTGGTLILNRQVVSTHGILVQGIYLQLPAIGTVVIGSASAYAS